MKKAKKKAAAHATKMSAPVRILPAPEPEPAKQEPAPAPVVEVKKPVSKPYPLCGQVEIPRDVAFLPGLLGLAQGRAEGRTASKQQSEGRGIGAGMNALLN